MVNKKPKRDAKGRLLPGQSGNLSGRPKSTKLTQKDKNHLVNIVKENIKDKNLLSEMLTFLLERAESSDAVFKYFKEFAPFLTPKLSSVKAEIEQDTTVTIKIEGFESIQIEDQAKVIEGETIKEKDDK